MKILILAHTAYKDKTPVEGPWSTVTKSLVSQAEILEVVKVPLFGYKNPVEFGNPENVEKLKIPSFLGEISPIKYTVDFVLTLFFIIRFALKYGLDNSVVIGVDSLITAPAVIAKPFLNYKIIFYCVDYNEKRFKNNLLSKIYETTDRIVSKGSDQIWAVCDSIITHKKKSYDVDAKYIPNSFGFDQTYYNKTVANRTLMRAVWTGSISTDKQITDILSLAQTIQKIRPEMVFWFIPTNKIDEFRKGIKKINLKNAQIFDVIGQEASRKLVSKCDIGIAIYDKDFGSTKYIEPIKIWEYMMLGIPFIISREPSISRDIKESGVALFLDNDNQIPEGNTLRTFISPQNIKNLRKNQGILSKPYAHCSERPHPTKNWVFRHPIRHQDTD